MMGDKLSRGACPEGDKGDTPIGGVSRLSRLRSGGDVPGLQVIDCVEVHEGDPVQRWAWEPCPEAARNTDIFPPAEALGGDDLPDNPSVQAFVDPEEETTHYATHQ